MHSSCTRVIFTIQNQDSVSSAWPEIVLTGTEFIVNLNNGKRLAFVTSEFPPRFVERYLFSAIEKLSYRFLLAIKDKSKQSYCRVFSFLWLIFLFMTGMKCFRSMQRDGKWMLSR